MDAALTTSEKVAETVLAYYRLLDVLPALAAEIQAWLQTLPSATKLQVELAGLDEVCRLPACIRFVLELRGTSMQGYMAAHLLPVELVYWLAEESRELRTL